MLPLLEKVFRGNIQFVRVEERRKVHLRAGDDGTVYHHLTPVLVALWKERRETGREVGRSEGNKMVRPTNGRWNESKETLGTERDTE